MAKLQAVYNSRENGYDIIDTERGVSVTFLQNKTVADLFVSTGVVTSSSIQNAVAEDVRISGGPVASPPEITSSGTTTTNSTYSGPTVGESTTYNTTSDPESQKILAELRKNNPKVGDKVDVSVVNDPLYERSTTYQVNPSENKVENRTPDPVGGFYSSQLNETTGRWEVVNDETGEVVASGLSEQESIITAQEYSVEDPYYNETTSPSDDLVSVREPLPVGGSYSPVFDDLTGKWQVVNDETGEVIASGLSEQEATITAQDYSVEDPYYRDLERTDETQPKLLNDEASLDAIRTQELLQQARNQATVSAQRSANGTAAGDGDWRVRLRLAPNADYLYKSNTPGILGPLRDTDGVVFPYTPRIDITYSAEYNAYDLTHSNYRGYFYKGSRVGEIVVNADFTAQDTNEANYLLAVIHFFKSATKMFYGQDAQRGAPPPVLYFSGLGEYQFNEHPCVISQFNYNLPADVDYIRARGVQTDSNQVNNGSSLLFRRDLQSTAAGTFSLSSIWSRLTGANLKVGAINSPPAPPNLGLNSPTYVPTKISISLTLLPVQSREQVSRQFSLQKFANGNLLKGGYW